MRRRGFLQLLGGAAAALTLELASPVIQLVEEANLAVEIAAMQDLFANEFSSIADKVFGASPFLNALKHREMAARPVPNPDAICRQVSAHTIFVGDPQDRLALLGELVVV